MKRMLLAVVTLSGCGSMVKVEPVKIQPIHITVDVNVHDREPGAAGAAVGDKR